MKPSRFEIALCLLLVVLVPICCVLLLGLRLGEAACDSAAGQTVYRFWFGRRG